MPRPKRVIGHLTPWVEWCDELEAENKRLKSRGIEDMQHELAELRKAAGEAKDLLWKMQNVQPYSDEIHYVGALLNTALPKEKGNE